MSPKGQSLSRAVGVGEVSRREVRLLEPTEFTLKAAHYLIHRQPKKDAVGFSTLILWPGYPSAAYFLAERIWQGYSQPF